MEGSTEVPVLIDELGGVATTFRANVDNVTDEKYWAGVFQSGFTTVGGARTYKLGVTFDF
jgi:iron complex outermembrane receptor protein